MIEWMSKVCDATAPSYVNGKKVPPIVEVIDFPSKATGEEIISICKRVRSVISSGRAVALVPESQDPLYQWSPEIVAQLVSNIPELDGCKHLLNWQCTYLDNIMRHLQLNRR